MSCGPGGDRRARIFGGRQQIAAFWALLFGLSLAAARSCAQGEHVDATGARLARLVRRLLGVWWGGVAFSAAGNILGRFRV